MTHSTESATLDKRTPQEQPGSICLDDLAALGKMRALWSEIEPMHAQGVLTEEATSMYQRAAQLRDRMALHPDGFTKQFAEQVIDGIAQQRDDDYSKDTHDVLLGIDEALRIYSGDDDPYRISPKQAAVRKEFALSIVDSLGRRQQGEANEADKLPHKVERYLVSSSPNILDHVGGLDDRIDLAVAAQSVSGLGRFVWEVTEGSMQNITFSKDPEATRDYLVRKVAQSDPVQQLELLKFYETMSRHATGASYGEEAAKVLRGVFAEVSTHASALTSIVADLYAGDTADRTRDDMQMTGDENTHLYGEEAFGYTGRYQLPAHMQGRYRVGHVAKNTLGLRDRYGVVRAVATAEDIPAVSDDEVALGNAYQFMTGRVDFVDQYDFYQNAKDFLLSRLAGDARSLIERTYEGRGLVQAIEELRSQLVGEPQEVAANDIVPLEERLGDHDASARLLQIVHRLSIREALEQHTGLSLAEIPLESQAKLLDYMVRRSRDEFDQLSVAAAKLESRGGSAAQFYETFLATEFGDDYGDSILSIAEHASSEHSKKIFETINNFRESSKKIARWYKSYDPELAKDIELAMNERLSDALTAMEVLARDKTLVVDTHPARNKEGYESDGRFVMQLHSVDEGIEIISGLGRSLQLLHDIVVADDVVVHRAVESNDNFMTYRFSSEQLGDVLLYARPEGAKGYDPQLEYGNREGVEASISFIVNPSDSHHLRLDKDPQGVSIRFDREGRLSDESPFSEDRDPTREEGSISLDISSLMGDGRHMPAKIGRLIAAGNILRAAKTGGEASLHHNTNHFDQKRYGTRGGFAKLAVYVAHMAEAMMAIQQNGSHASPYQSIPKAG